MDVGWLSVCYISLDHLTLQKPAGGELTCDQCTFNYYVSRVCPSCTTYYLGSLILLLDLSTIWACNQDAKKWVSIPEGASFPDLVTEDASFHHTLDYMLPYLTQPHHLHWGGSWCVWREWMVYPRGGGGVDGDDEDNTDDPSGILNPGKTFIQGFLSLMNFLKARDKHPEIIFNIFAVIYS